MENDVVYIYGLYDPRDLDYIRYVGKSVDPKRRFNTHISNRNISFNEKSIWIKNLMEIENIIPEYKILEITNSENWQDREKFWIDSFLSDGYSLTNMTVGGNGFHLLDHMRESWLVNITKARRKQSSKRGTSKYKGVSMVTSTGKWEAYIKLDSKTYHLGTFISEKQAAIRRDFVARKWIGPDAYLNFPHDATIKNISYDPDWRLDKKKYHSNYIGVSFNKNRNKWTCYVKQNKKTINLGYFKEESEAALIRDIAVKSYGINNTKLNFPNDSKVINTKYNLDWKPTKTKTSSKYIGVCFHKRHNKWNSSIGTNGKNYNIGSFSTQEEAALHRDWVAKKWLGDKAKLNFPSHPVIKSVVHDPSWKFSKEEIKETFNLMVDS